MKRKSLAWLVLVVMLLGVLAGCGSNAANSGNPAPDKVSNTEKTYPLTVKDDSGTEVTLPAKPVRIVSLVPSHTETLFALGLEGKVVAVTQFDNYPKDVQKKVEYVFQDALNPSTEQILKLNPDLIILSSQPDKTVTAIRNLKIPVLKLDPQNLEATYKTIETLGLATGTKDKADAIIAQMKQKEADIAKKISTLKEADKVRVWTEVSSDLYTPGQGTFMDELITKAGGINIASDVKGWAQYSEEKVISKNPQVILTTYGYYEPNAVEKVLARKAWQNTDAIKNKRVVNVDSDMVNRPGPRIIDGMELIAKALYPDLFK